MKDFVEVKIPGYKMGNAVSIGDVEARIATRKNRWRMLLLCAVHKDPNQKHYIILEGSEFLELVRFFSGIHNKTFNAPKLRRGACHECIKMVWVPDRSGFRCRKCGKIFCGPCSDKHFDPDPCKKSRPKRKQGKRMSVDA